MKADFPALWAESPGSLRRDPTNAELASGIPCGPADRFLFNELFYRLSGMQRELIELVVDAGLVPSGSDYEQVAKAIQSGLLNYGAAGGTANALTLTLPVAPAALAAGLPFLVQIGTANTGAATINVNGLGAKPIRLGGAALVGGELQVGRLVAMAYDGTNVQILGGSSSESVAVAASDVTLTSTADQSIAADTDTIVPVVGSNPAWATLSGGRLTITKRGLYTVNGYISFGSTSTNNTTTYYYASIYKNGTRVATRLGIQNTLGSTPTTFSQGADYVLFLDVGDIIDLRGAVSVGSFSVAAASIKATSLFHLVKVA